MAGVNEIAAKLNVLLGINKLGPTKLLTGELSGPVDLTLSFGRDEFVSIQDIPKDVSLLPQPGLGRPQGK